MFRTKEQRLFERGVKLLNSADREWISREFRGSYAKSPIELYLKAIECFMKVVKINYKNAEAWCYMGRACFSTGCEFGGDTAYLKRAIDCCKKALEIEPGNEDIQVDCSSYISQAESLLKR